MIYKPQIQSVPLSTALTWTGGQYLFEEKLDGVFTERAVGQSVIVGETMHDGQFYAFDIPVLDGHDIRRAPLGDRLECLSRFSFKRPKRGNGGEFLEAILASGGEGVVAKEFNQPYGRGWFKAKRCQVFYVVVTRKSGDGKQSVSIAYAPFQDVKNPMPENWGFQDVKNLAPAGNLALRGDKFDSVRVGSILKVEAFGKHASGLLREARLDRDAASSWLVRF